MTGELAEGAIPGLLQEIYVGRRSGTLNLVRGEERQSLRFQGGHIVNAHTNVVQERLGEVLVRRGLLSEQDLARATEIVVTQGRRLGEVLVELGLLTASGLEDAVALHVHQMLASVFTWKEGSYTFEDEPAQASPAEELTLKLSTGDLILEAVQAVGDPDVVRYALGDLDRVLALSNDPLLRFQKLTLSPADGFVLSRVDGTASAREIIQMIPLPLEDTQRSLLGLLSTGAIEYVPGSRRAPDAAAPVSAESGPRPAAAAERYNAPPERDQEPLVEPVEEPVVPTAPSAPAAEPGPGEAPPAPAAEAAPAPAEDGEAGARRREIMEAWEGLKTRTHFEVLGLARAATESDVKEAYFRLARRFHPDVHHGASLGDMRDKLEAVFIRLGEAYDVLRDRDKRGDYESRLGRPRPGLQRAGETGSSAAGPDERPEPEAPRDPETDAKLAEVSIRKAIRLFEKAEGESADKKPKLYSDAIQLLEGALPFATGRLRIRGGVTLARCYLKNPNWARRAEELLLGLVKEDPKAADPLALLAGIYRDNGLRVRALSTFRRVLELQPDHEEAARYVAQNAPAATPAPEDEGSGGGLLKKLFRKP
jgi:tetratricopeptide (TPR) repeat protein